MCKAMLTDPGHIFHRMWGAQSWRFAGDEYKNPMCWNRVRDDKQKPMPTEQYFRETMYGDHCDSNWYEGGVIRGGQFDRPIFENAGTPLLGFDETIEGFCRWELEQMKVNATEGITAHVENCLLTGNSILALYGERFPYNICRNLEWMVCAARGKLPGQRGDVIHFAKRPNELVPNSEDKPLGKCRGWRAGDHECHDDPYNGPFDGESEKKRRITGYATDSIFFLEVCMYSQICSNGDELFGLFVGQDWRCQFSETGFKDLQRWLADAEYVPHWKPGEPQDLVIHYKPDAAVTV